MSFLTSTPKQFPSNFVVLPYDGFLQMQAEIEDYEDLRTLRKEKATAHAEPTRSLD